MEFYRESVRMRRMAAAAKSLYAALRAVGGRSGRVKEELPGARRGREALADVSPDLGAEASGKGK